MNKVIKLIPLLCVVLVFSGCASSVNKQQVRSQPQVISPLINFEPAIDLSYTEVNSNIKENIGSTVRWGGQIINTQVVDESTTRLTVLASPLGTNGRPVNVGQSANSGGRFIVELNEGLAQGVEFDGHFVTFYGEVVDQVLLTNGNKEKNIPLVSASELVDWDIADRQQYADGRDRRGNAFYSLGFRTGHFYYPGRRSFSRFGGFSRSRFTRFSGGSSFKNRGFRSGSFRSRGFRRY